MGQVAGCSENGNELSDSQNEVSRVAERLLASPEGPCLLPGITFVLIPMLMCIQIIRVYVALCLISLCPITVTKVEAQWRVRFSKTKSSGAHLCTLRLHGNGGGDCAVCRVRLRSRQPVS